MPHRPIPSPPPRPARGFTLLELLVTLSVLAALAVVGTQIFAGPNGTVLDGAQASLARSEMRAVADAILRFKRDTGFLPRQGPFADSDDDYQNFPANLAQLFLQPVNKDTGDKILPWNADTGRGWHGPYLSEMGEGRVWVGDNLQTDGSGDPTGGAPRLVWAVADPFEYADHGLIWRDSQDLEVQRAAPYLLFVDEDVEAASGVSGCRVPCLVSLGPNGRYEHGEEDDIVLNF